MYTQEAVEKQTNGLWFGVILKTPNIYNFKYAKRLAEEKGISKILYGWQSLNHSMKPHARKNSKQVASLFHFLKPKGSPPKKNYRPKAIHLFHDYANWYYIGLDKPSVLNKGKMEG